MTRRDLQPLLAPRSVAVIGASPSSRVGLNMVRNLQQLGYGGTIYPVNPRYEEVAGLRCYPSLAAIPGEIDVIVVGVATRYVLPTLEEAVASGVRAAMIASVGFGEAGEEGRARQEELLTLARQHGLLVHGPNCMGIVSPANRHALYIGNIPSELPRGRIAAVCQSGSVAIGLMMTGRLGLSHLVSSGNEADVSLEEYLAHFVEDPEIDVLLAFVEGFRRPSLFLEVADRARELGKPLIVLKVGLSARSAAAALAHTGALAGSAAVFRAMCRQKGVIQVADLDELIETGVLCAALHGRPPRGPGVGVLSGSGGLLGLALDLADEAGLTFPLLGAATRERLAEALPPGSTLSNPLDAWGTGDVQATYPRCLAAMAAEEQIDLVAAYQDAPAMQGGSGSAITVARALAALREDTDKPLVFFTNVAGAVNGEAEAVLGAAGIPLLRGARPSIRALAHYLRARASRAAPDEAPSTAAPGIAAAVALLDHAAEPVLSEHASLAVLAHCGVRVPRQALVATAEEAAAAAEGIGFPVALKVCSPDLPHKTDSGAVRLSLGDAAAVRAAGGDVLANARRAAPEARIEGLLVQEMVRGQELIVGVAGDPDFGPTVLLGTGGVFAEALGDVSLRLAPLTAADAAAMLDELRGRALLDGARGQRPVDRQAVIAVLLALSRLAIAAGHRLAQLDVNPLLVSADGAVAADALVVLNPTAAG
jgi:acetate---CoA ligase (ADP-forming)